MRASTAGLLAFSSAVLAQQSTWGQCGGIGWSGATTCTSGNVCVKLNDYYSQCQPGTASSTTSKVTPSSTATTTTKPSIAPTTTSSATPTTLITATSSAAPSSTSTSVIAAPSSVSENLLVSHFSGSLYALQYTSNGNNGTLTQKQQTTGCGNMPSWLEWNASASTAYCVDESSYNSPKLSSLTVNTDGTVKLLGQTTVSGSDVYGGLFGNGFIALAEYDPGTMSVYSTQLSSSSQLLSKTKFTISQPGPNSSRQSSAHPHSAIADPTNKYLVVPDLGGDALHIFQTNAATGAITACPDAKTAAGDGPRHGAWWAPTAGSTAGQMLYTVNELGNSVSAWQVSYPSGSGCLALTRTQTLSVFAPGTSAPSRSQPVKAAEVHVAGNYLYAAVRNDQLFGSQQDSLVRYNIDSTTGAISYAEAVNSHSWYPRTFSINKAGTLIAMGGQTSSNVAILSRDPSTGKVGGLLASLAVGQPGTDGGENGLSSVVWTS